MNADKQTILVELLKFHKNSGKNFHESKQLLLNEGYSEDEIAIAAGSVSFGEKQDTGDDTSVNASSYYVDEIARNQYDKANERQLVRRTGLIGYLFSRTGMTKAIWPIVILGLLVLAVSYGLSTTTHLIEQKDIINILIAYFLAIIIFFIVRYVIDKIFDKLIGYKVELKGNKPHFWWVLAKILELVITFGLTVVAYFTIIKSLL